MYRRPLTAEKAKAIATFGFTPDELIGGDVTVWPDNRQAVVIFQAMRTQWRAAMRGLIGLDYGALPEVWRRLKVPIADRDAVFADLQVLEAAALDEMHTED